MAAGRWAVRAGRRGWRLTRRAAYFLLPPAVYDAVKRCAPRVCQGPVRAELATAVRRRLGTPSPAPVAPTGPDTAAQLARFYAEAYVLPENRPEEVRAKAAKYRHAAELRIDRVRLLRELARLAEAEGNALLGAAYRVRAMRLTGHDRYGDMYRVRPVLTAAGLVAEAAAVAAMYGPDPRREETCTALLESARERWRTPHVPDVGYTVYDDRRGTTAPRVSVITTVYNGADKLAAFLQALQVQSLNRAGGMELILIDSQSPKDEHAALKAVELFHPIPTLFVRTAARETIQAAWNRGLGLARAPYIALLGVDESFAPPALADLAARLDADPAVDWVQADAVVSNVDRAGALADDVMTYNRAGLTPCHPYLDGTYLGPVCAVYRKSVHDRFGYFDSTFRAAGDTEFKNRVLPGLTVAYVNRPYGLYLNYPEDRATGSVAAELEDYRAWHLHRTTAGVRYAFGARPVSELEQMLVLSLRYRKSYTAHESTDFEYADAVCEVLWERDPAAETLALAPGVARGLETLRRLDHLPTVSQGRHAPALTAAWESLAAVEAAHRATPWVPDAEYRAFNDNLHEHHHWYW